MYSVDVAKIEVYSFMRGGEGSHIISEARVEVTAQVLLGRSA